MTRNIIALIGLALLAGCSGGGGGDPAAPSSAPAPPAQPDMLTATPAGLLRGKASGQGQHEIFHFPNLHKETPFVSDGNIVYPRTGQLADIWTVRTDGTGDHALVNTPAFEFARAVSGPWLLYSNDKEEEWSVRLDTQAQVFLDTHFFAGSNVQFQGADRALIGTEQEIFSIALIGGNRVTYAVLTQQESDQEAQLSPPLIVADALVYRRLTQVSPFSSTFSSNLFAIPASGGTTTPLDSGQDYVFIGGAIGARVIYHRCPLVSQNTAGPCDVVSVQNNGAQSVVLVSHPANEAVQGVTTDQVIIRRNLSGNDQLIAVPVAGGNERLLMTMTDSEFVDTIIGDTIIVRRPSGTWTLNLSGTLKQLSTIAGLDGFVAVGNAICSSDVVWCMPLDGSAPAVKIANEGKVVGVL
jgi:hypothetical protein